jgi:hypothetical protein
MASRGLLQLVGALTLGCGGAWAVSSCNLGAGYADFGKDVAQPELVVIDGPGTKIADGQLSGMLVDPWGDKGAVVVGFRYLADGPYLRMQPFDGTKGCNVGRAYRCIVFNRLPNEPQLIAYLDDIGANNRGTLYFTDHSCKVAYGGIKDAELPARLFDSPPGFVLRAGDQLLEVDPFRKKTRVIANNLQYWNGPGDSSSPMPVWFIAGGQLVVLDNARQEALRLGNAVTEVVFEASDPNQGLFLVDGGALTRYVEATGTEPKVIATDACGASLSSYGISYFSPCNERRLVIQDLTQGTTYEVDSGVWRLLYAQKRSRTDGTGVDIEAAYTKPSTMAGFEDLWLKQAGAAPRVWQQRLGSFISATTGSNPTLVAIVDSDGTKGRLMRVDSSGEHTLFENVALGYSVESIAGGWLLLTDVVDGLGTLVWITEAGERQTVAEGVAVSGAVKTPEKNPELTGVTDDRYYDLRAFLTNVEVVDGTPAGTIALLNRNNLDSLQPLGTRVPADKFDFFRNMTAVGYLDKYDTATGTGALTVYQTRIGATSVVAKNVNEYSELLWPWEGVIYSVKVGESYSIWAARAKP